MSQIQNLETLVDYINIGIVVTLGLSFIFGGASIYFSRDLNKAKDLQAENE